MLEERFRFMYLGKEGTDLKQISLSRKKFYFFASLATCVLIVLAAFIVNLFTHNFHNVRISLLEKDREHLQKELLTMKERVSTISSKLEQVQKTGDELRNATGLSSIDQDTRQVGVGGPLYYSSLDFGYYPDEITNTAQEVRVDLDKLERSIRLELTSIDQIYKAMHERDDFVNRFPSINPVLGGRINGLFGMRVDPFFGKFTPHQGVDINMPAGTPVVAAGDGVVKISKNNFIPFRSYGREVVIDHGYGYCTRYAHLSKIKVHVGQRVKRWEIIGEVGQTGKATGPHLHYEVIQTEKKENPYYYMLNYGDTQD